MIEFRRWNEDGCVTYKINSEHLSLPELMQEFRYFLLALGYHPEGVEEEIEAD